MTYADFEYYSGTYMGAVSEEDFPRLVVRASSFLDYYTRNRAQDSRAPQGARGLKFTPVEGVPESDTTSRPARGAWVEIRTWGWYTTLPYPSRPARGAWVEIQPLWPSLTCVRSRPARGAWVEIIAMQER